MARPRIPIDVAEVERLAARGLDKRQICHALGISPDTLRRRETDNQRVTDALERGRARGLADVASALFERALDGDTRAQIYYLRSRGGWTEPAPRSDATPERDDMEPKPLPESSEALSRDALMARVMALAAAADAAEDASPEDPAALWPSV